MSILEALFISKKKIQISELAKSCSYTHMHVYNIHTHLVVFSSYWSAHELHWSSAI
jgi:hypothetical protein